MPIYVGLAQARPNKSKNDDILFHFSLSRRRRTIYASRVVFIPYAYMYFWLE